MEIKQFIISKVTDSLLTILIVGGLILFLDYEIKDYFKTKEIKNAIEISKLEERISELHRFIDTNIVQAPHKLVTETQLKNELETLLKNNKELKKYIDGNNEDIKRFIKAEFTFKNQTGGGKGAIEETKSENNTVARNYTYSDNFLDLSFSLESLLAKYKIKLENIPLELNIIQTELPDGRFKLNDYILIKRIDTGEELHIKNAIVQEVLQKDKLLRFSLTSLIGSDYSKDVSLSIGASLWSYGRTLSPKDTEYRIGLFGVSGNKENLGLYLVPITWNIGKIIPFIQEMQIGVGIVQEITSPKHKFIFGAYHNF